MKTLLLTGARAPVTLDLARSLKKKGVRVIAAESMEFPLSKYSKAFDRFFTITAPNTSLDLFKIELVQIIKTEKVDLLLSTCEEAFHVAKIKSELPCEVLVDDFQKLNQLHSKFDFNQLCLKLGLFAPESKRVHSIDEAKRAINEITSHRIVLKPEYSRFASKTIVTSKHLAFEILPNLNIDEETPWVTQECLEGPEYCTYSFAKSGVLLAHVTYEHEFTAGRGAGICFQSINHQGIETWVQNFVKATNYTGQIAFDFIETSSRGVQALECNPRATSGLHLIAQNPDFITAILNPINENSAIVKPLPGTLAQLRLAMLVYGLPSIRSFKRLKAWIHIFSRAREVVYDSKDPAPFFDQFISFYHLIRQSRKLKITPLEVSTRDIEWNGGPAHE